MRGLLGLLFLWIATTAGTAQGALTPAEMFQSLNDEISWNCVEFNAPANAPLAAIRAEEVVNAVENVARSRADFFSGSSSDPASFTFNLNRPCFNVLLASPRVTESVRERLRLALADIAAPRTAPSRSFTAPGAAETGEGAVKHFFPWPPPIPTVFHTEDLDVVPGKKVSAVYNKIRQRLEAIGYHQFHFLTPGGFAIVADIENIDQVGRPTANRWAKSVRRLSNFDLASIVRGVLVGDLGRYRVMVIVLTDDTSPFSDKPLTEKLLDDWKAAGKPLIQPDLLDQPITAQHHVYYLVYEFNSTKNGMEFIPSSAISWQAHLQGAGLWPLSDLQ